MRTRLMIALMAAIVLAAASGPFCSAQEFYYDLNQTYAVAPSLHKIAVQFDTTRPVPTLSAFFAAHPALNATVGAKYLHRGYQICELQPSIDYSTCVAQLLADGAVHRVVPVYMTTVDSAEFKVSDLVDVQFDDDLRPEAALALLTGHGLRFVDSSVYRHNLWTCALDDTAKGSPLAYGNVIHRLPGVTWACARQYASPMLAGPTDPYYVNQYYLKNTGQYNGVVGADIAAEQAWRVPLRPQDSSLLVAVIDDGSISHTDLPASRILPGYDFAGNCLDTLVCHPPLPPDNDPTPGTYRNHGMACAGILAASHNGVGIVGVDGGCRILPVKIFDNNGSRADTIPIADAIYFARDQGARIISCSWVYAHQTSPIVAVANAIRYAVDPCPGCLAASAPVGSVVVFAAGDDADWNFPAVEFPANMPEVIAVGAVRNTGQVWDYSCHGTGLDVVAPAGDDGDGRGLVSWFSNLWTIDQLGDLGWNPHVSGAGDAGGDPNYTTIIRGTSGACPQVAGIAALLMSRGHAGINTYRPYQKIQEIIDSSAVQDMVMPGWNEYYGWGRANAFRAMLSIIHGDVTNDAIYDISDVMLEISIAFTNGHAVLDDRTADVNCDGNIDVGDVLYLNHYVFVNGPPPPICFRY